MAASLGSQVDCGKGVTFEMTDLLICMPVYVGV